MDTMRSGRGFCLVGFALLASACGNAPPAPEAHATQNDVTKVQGTINGQLVQSLEQGPGHVLEFYDFDNGEVGVRESLPIGDSALLDTLKEPKSLTDIFRLARPGAVVPIQLVQADQRAADYNAAHPPATPPAATLIDNGPASAATPPSTGSVRVQSEPTGTISSAVTGCSNDYYADGWGGDWFISNYCNEGCYRNCYKNAGSGYWDTDYNWFRWKQMEGDFNVPGHTHGWRTGYPYPGTGLQIWNYDVQPRRIEIWTMTGGSMTKHAEGNSPCGHMQFAALRCG